MCRYRCIRERDHLGALRPISKVAVRLLWDVFQTVGGTTVKEKVLVQLQHLAMADWPLRPLETFNWEKKREDLVNKQRSYLKVLSHYLAPINNT
jgi:hypothetical protein